MTFFPRSFQNAKAGATDKSSHGCHWHLACRCPSNACNTDGQAAPGIPAVTSLRENADRGRSASLDYAVGGDVTAEDRGPGMVRLAGLHGRPRLSEPPRPRGGPPALRISVSNRFTYLPAGGSHSSVLLADDPQACYTDRKLKLCMLCGSNR